MFRLSIRKLLGPELQYFAALSFSGIDTTGACFGLALADADGPTLEVDLLPTQQPQFRVPHAGIRARAGRPAAGSVTGCPRIRPAGCFSSAGASALPWSSLTASMRTSGCTFAQRR